MSETYKFRHYNNNDSALIAKWPEWANPGSSTLWSKREELAKKIKDQLTIRLDEAAAVNTFVLERLTEAGAEVVGFCKIRECRQGAGALLEVIDMRVQDTAIFRKAKLGAKFFWAIINNVFDDKSDIRLFTFQPYQGNKTRKREKLLRRYDQIAIQFILTNPVVANDASILVAGNNYYSRALEFFREMPVSKVPLTAAEALQEETGLERYEFSGFPRHLCDFEEELRRKLGDKKTKSRDRKWTEERLENLTGVLQQTINDLRNSVMNATSLGFWDAVRLIRGVRRSRYASVATLLKLAGFADLRPAPALGEVEKLWIVGPTMLERMPNEEGIAYLDSLCKCIAQKRERVYFLPEQEAEEGLKTLVGDIAKNVQDEAKRERLRATVIANSQYLAFVSCGKHLHSVRRVIAFRGHGRKFGWVFGKNMEAVELDDADVESLHKDLDLLYAAHVGNKTLATVTDAPVSGDQEKKEPVMVPNASKLTVYQAVEPVSKKSARKRVKKHEP